MATDHTEASSAHRGPPTWLRVLLGIVLILGGLFVLGDIALATLVSTLFIGFTAVVVGVFEIVHALWTKGWGGFLWQILLGALYIAFGLLVVSQPSSGALVLTVFLGMALLVSGLVRVFLAYRHWADMGWIMIVSGMVGVLGGLIILTGLPMTGIWVLGLLLGIDLLLHGGAWLIYGWLPSARAAQQTA